MVKILLVFFFLTFSLVAKDNFLSAASTNTTEKNDLLIEKIKTFVTEESYSKNKNFINFIFSPVENFYRQDRVDIVKVAQTLKENGLLNLFFDAPRELQLSFTTSGSPLFFVKIMGDALRNIGYYRYVTMESNLNNAGFTWTISLKAEYATDPLILQEELGKSGCSIIDITRNNPADWAYSIDMSKGNLSVPILKNKEAMELKRSLYAHWLNVEKIKNLKIKSSFRDKWFPKITFYDKQLHLLKVIEKSKKTRTLSLEVPNNAKYIKIDDMYTLKNVKDKLKLDPSGTK